MAAVAVSYSNVDPAVPLGAVTTNQNTGASGSVSVTKTCSDSRVFLSLAFQNVPTICPQGALNFYTFIGSGGGGSATTKATSAAGDQSDPAGPSTLSALSTLSAPWTAEAFEIFPYIPPTPTATPSYSITQTYSDSPTQTPYAGTPTFT